MSGKPQQGLAEDLAGSDKEREAKSDQQQSGSRTEPGLTTVDAEQFRLLQQAQRVEFIPMPVPTLPP